MANLSAEPRRYSSSIHPMAKWIVGQDAYDCHVYLIHSEYPAFFAKISRDPDEGILSELSYALPDDRSLFDFVWYDPYPDHADFMFLMLEAEAAVASFFERIRQWCG